MGAGKVWRSALLGALLGGLALAVFVWLRSAPQPPPVPPPDPAASAPAVPQELPRPEPDPGVPDGGPLGAEPETPEAPEAASVAAKGARSVPLLAESLASGPSFRVRMRAALALGRLRGNRAAGDALMGALDDPHPAVRAAAARSLGKGRHRRARGTLERLQREDPEAPVRKAAKRALARLAPRRAPTAPPVRARGGAIHVRVGAPSAPTGGVPGTILAELRGAAEAQLRAADGIALGGGGPKGRSFYLDVSVGPVDQGPEGTRATATVLIQTDPGRSIKASVRGKATVPGAHDARALRDAVRGAVRSAMRKVPGVVARLAQ